MADHVEPALDPGLEAVLRSALRAEAASIPFRLRPEDVAPRVARTGRGTRPILLIAAAALLGLTTGGVLLAGAFRPPERVVPTPMPVAPGVPQTGLGAIPSFDRLRELLAFEVEIAKTEGFAETDTTTVIRGDQVVPWVGIAYSCSGPGIAFEPISGGPRPVPLPIDCSGGSMEMPVIWTKPDATGGIAVKAKAGTAWRAIVAGRPSTVHDVPAPNAPVQIEGLPPGYFELKAPGEHPGPVLARAAGVATTSDEAFVVGPWPASSQISITIACLSGPAEIALGTEDLLDVGFGIGIVACDVGPLDLPVRAGLETPAFTVLRVRVPSGSPWAVLVTDDMPAPASLEP